MLDSVWLVPLCPLVGAMLNGFFGRRYSRATVGQIAIAAVGIAFLVSLMAFIALLSGAEPQYQVRVFPWIAAGAYSAQVGFLIDGLSCTMMLVVTGVGLLIHIYSTGYMHDEEDYARYFTYLNLFVGAMLILIMADNYLLMFVGWEGVGLCSYLLIGFWYTRQSAADAGKKAFIVNRIGDFGFMLAILLLFVTFKTTDMLSVQEQLKHLRGGQWGAHGYRPAVVHRRGGEIGAGTAVRLAAGCDGGSHAGQCAHSCRDHGHGRGLHDGALVLAVYHGPDRVGDRGLYWYCDGPVCGHDGPRGDGYQARPGLLHRESAGLYGVCRGCGGVCRGDLPPGDACVL